MGSSKITYIVEPENKLEKFSAKLFNQFKEAPLEAAAPKFANRKLHVVHADRVTFEGRPIYIAKLEFRCFDLDSEGRLKEFVARSIAKALQDGARAQKALEGCARHEDDYVVRINRKKTKEAIKEADRKINHLQSWAPDEECLEFLKQEGVAAIAEPPLPSEVFRYALKESGLSSLDDWEERQFKYWRDDSAEDPAAPKNFNMYVTGHWEHKKRDKFRRLLKKAFICSTGFWDEAIHGDQEAWIEHSLDTAPPEMIEWLQLPQSNDIIRILLPDLAR